MSKLQDMREKVGLTQWQLSLLSEIPITTIQKYEIGKANIDGAKIKTLAILAKVLNCRIEDIIEDEYTISLLKLNS